MHGVMKINNKCYSTDATLHVKKLNAHGRTTNVLSNRLMSGRVAFRVLTFADNLGWIKSELQSFRISLDVAVVVNCTIAKKRNETEKKAKISQTREII